MRILKINPKKINKEEIRVVVDFLKAGKVVILPTDTVYGLVCDASKRAVIDRLFKIKKRPKAKPIPVFVKDSKKAKEIAEIKKDEEVFLKSVWPGKVTAILKRNKGYAVYGVEKDRIALRIPKYKLVDEVFKKINIPLAGTSANIADLKTVRNLKDIKEQFGKEKHQPDLVVYAGVLRAKKPSTIIDLTLSPPKVLRK